MRAPPGVDLRGLLEGIEYSDRLAKARGIGSPFCSLFKITVTRKSLTRLLSSQNVK